MEELLNDVSRIEAEARECSALADSSTDAVSKEYYRRKELLLREKKLVLLKLLASQVSPCGPGMGKLAGAEAVPGTLRFASASDFLSTYDPHRLELLPGSSSQTMDVKCTGPSVVAPWHTFDEECRAMLRMLQAGGPVAVVVPETSAASVDNEDDLGLKLLTHLLSPLEQALARLDGSFKATGGANGVTKGMWTNKSDFVLESRISKELLVVIEVKTSAVICVPQDSTLPAAYAGADSDSNIVKCVAQLFSYLDVVPYGVLVTDQQLFCMRREGTALLCSPSIPLAGYVHCPAERGRGRPSSAELLAASCAAAAAREQLKAAGGRSADSLTAVAALYCMAKMSQQWWARQPPQQPPGGAGQPGSSGDSGADTSRAGPPESSPHLTLASCGIRTSEGAQHSAASAAPAPALRLPAGAESECTSRQLFRGRSFDPRVPHGMPPSLGNACLGVVVEGAVGGRAAAVKLVDLWQGPEGREALLREVRIYQVLQPLQGVYVPHLLGYGFCDGWQYFLASSLEGPTLSSEEGWALGEEATCAAAFAALDAVHRCGVLHGDIALRNLVLTAQPAGVGGSAAGGGGDKAGESQPSTTGQQPQLQPRVMLLDFGHAQLVAEAATERGEEPASLMQRERRALQDELGWEPPPPLPVPLPPVGTGPHPGAGIQAAAASGATGGGGTGGQAQRPQRGMREADTDRGLPGGSAAASEPSPPAAQSRAGPLSALPPPPPPPPRPPSGWGQQLRSARPQVPHMPRPLAWIGLNEGRSASRLLLRRMT